ncbi:MAG: serine/threonine-protein phosphatase [Betaproteobacteria bacterium]|nr:serine/threonine-protein phosphatase [Betaproteobacteria bacterium]
MKYTIFQDTRIGKRPYQQDRIAHWCTQESLYLVLADGMGGHAHGDVAAQIAVDCLGSAFCNEAKPRIADPENFLFRTVGRAHAMIVHQTRRRGLAAQDLSNSPRTTVVACLVQDGYAYWSYVGDSRLYLIRDGRIVTRTRDHTPVQMLVDAGRIREEAAAMHPDRNKLLQCLGGPRAPQVEPTGRARLAQNDLVLLCSDGFWGPLTQRQLLVGVLGKNMERALLELIDLAETCAGPRCDNVSVLAIEWHDQAVPAPFEQETVAMSAQELRPGRIGKVRS